MRGETEAQQVTITPAGDSVVRCHRAGISDLPTMHHVINALADLPVIEGRGGSLTHSYGSKWSRDQRVLV